MNKFYCILILVLSLVSVTPAVAQDYVIDDTTESAPVMVTKSTPRFLPARQTGPVIVRQVPTDTLNSIRNDDAYWYANLEPAKKKAEEPVQSRPPANTGWIANILWILILVSFIAVVIWYLASSNVQLFRKSAKTILQEEEPSFEDDIFSVNYDAEISKAKAAQNFRLAIRLWYLRTLKELADRNLIDYRHEKTNSQYISQLSHTAYYRPFFGLTRNFEYIWYGQFPLSEENYEILQTDFLAFKNGLH